VSRLAEIDGDAGRTGGIGRVAQDIPTGWFHTEMKEWRQTGGKVVAKARYTYPFQIKPKF
jgi:hypothetical protein